jgi:hypothetical protein
MKTIGQYGIPTLTAYLVLSYLALIFVMPVGMPSLRLTFFLTSDLLVFIASIVIFRLTTRAADSPPRKLAVICLMLNLFLCTIPVMGLIGNGGGP